EVGHDHPVGVALHQTQVGSVAVRDDGGERGGKLVQAGPHGGDLVVGGFGPERQGDDVSDHSGSSGGGSERVGWASVTGTGTEGCGSVGSVAGGSVLSEASGVSSVVGGSQVVVGAERPQVVVGRDSLTLVVWVVAGEQVAVS